MSKISTSDLRMVIVPVGQGTELHYYTPDDTLILTIPGSGIKTSEAVKMQREAVEVYNTQKEREEEEYYRETFEKSIPVVEAASYELELSISDAELLDIDYEYIE